MTRSLTALMTGATIAGAVMGLASTASAASPADRQQSLLVQVNSIGWGARVNRERYDYVYGNDDGPRGYDRDDEDGYREQYRRGHRRPVRAAPYSYQFDDDQF